MSQALSNESKLIGYVSAQLKDLIGTAIDRGEHEVELLVSPHLHGTLPDKILGMDIEAGAWDTFGEHALNFKSEASRTDTGVAIKFEVGGGEKRRYDVTVTRQGVLLSFKVRW